MQRACKGADGELSTAVTLEVGSEGVCEEQGWVWPGGEQARVVGRKVRGRCFRAEGVGSAGKHCWGGQ